MKLWQKISTGIVVVGVAATPALVDKFDKYADALPQTQFEKMLEASENPGMIKVEELSKVKIKNSGKKEGEFSLRGIDVKISELSREGRKLKVVATAERDGKKLNVDSPYYFVNPPVKVMTGKYHKEIIDGKEWDVPNDELNFEEALKEIIVQTIELQN